MTSSQVIDRPTARTDPAVDGPTRRGRSRLWSGLVLSAGLTAAVLLYHSMWSNPAHLILGSAHHTNDPMQMMWNLRWVPWSIAHGHNPFQTHALYYPSGVALSWNTSAPTLGILAAPLTFTAGPVFTFQLLMTVAPALLGLTTFWWLRRYTRYPLPAAVGGLLAGFSPYVDGHLLGHLNLVFAATIPILFMLIEDLLWRRPRPARRTAVYLGLLAAAQAGISEELLLIAAISALVAVGFAAIWLPGVGSSLKASWSAGLGAVAIFLVAASPLLVDQLLLSRSIPLHSASWRATLDDYLYPIGNQLMTLGVGHRNGLGGAEDGVFAGPALIVVVLAGLLVTVWRDRASRVAGATLVVLVAITFGSNPPGWSLWRPFAALPALRSVLPTRFSFAVALVLAWLLARWLDQLAQRWAGRRVLARLATVLAITAVLGSLVPLVPRPLSGSPAPPRVAFFSSAQLHRLVPRNAPVLLLPAPDDHDASGMYYQSVADFWFDQPGGYALRPVPGGASVDAPPSPLLDLAQAARAADPPEPADPAALDAARVQLTSQGYRAIIVVTADPAAPNMIHLAEQLTGRRADRVIGGVEIWMLAPRR